MYIYMYIMYIYMFNTRNLFGFFWRLRFFLAASFFIIISGSQLTCFFAFRCLSFVSHIGNKTQRRII